MRKPREKLVDAHASFAPQCGADWLRKYQGDSARYAWWFFVGMSLVIATVIRLGLDAFNGEWAAATAFAIFVFWLLAYFSRRTSCSRWSGRVVDREIKVIRRTGEDGGGTPRYSHRVLVRTEAGKKVTLRVGPELYSYYEPGMPLVKVSGLNYPLPQRGSDAPPLCPVCGRLQEDAPKQCKACRAPLYSLAELLGESSV